MGFTIFFEGSPRLPRSLSTALEEAGFSISTPKRTQGARSSRLFAVELTVARGGKKRHGAPREAALPAEGMSLRGLREDAGRTQGEIARRIAMTQPQLSRVEARRDHLTSTLRKYVRALGGRIEVVAVVKGRRIVLQGV